MKIYTCLVIIGSLPQCGTPIGFQKKTIKSMINSLKGDTKRPQPLYVFMRSHFSKKFMSSPFQICVPKQFPKGHKFYVKKTSPTHYYCKRCAL